VKQAHGGGLLQEDGSIPGPKAGHQEVGFGLLNSRNMRCKVGNPKLWPQVQDRLDVRQGAFEHGLKSVPAVSAIGIVIVNASDGLNFWKMFGGEDSAPNGFGFVVDAAEAPLRPGHGFFDAFLGRRIPG